VNPFERFQAHQHALAAAEEARSINPHPPLSVEWYAHALKVMEREKHEAETRLEESRRQVDLLREELQAARIMIHRLQMDREVTS